MPGNRVSVEFRASSQGRRKTVHQEDEYADRFGYRLAINPIYAETFFSSEIFSSVSGNKTKQYKSRNKDLGT